MIETPVLERVLSEALRNGGDFAEVFAEDRSNSSALLDDGRVEELASGRERGAGIRVVAGETTGFAHTADLTEPGCCGRPRRPRPWPAAVAAGTRTVAVGTADRVARPDPPAADGRHRRPGPRRDALELLAGPTRPPARPGGGISQVQAGFGDVAPGRC